MVYAETAETILTEQDLIDLPFEELSPEEEALIEGEGLSGCIGGFITGAMTAATTWASAQAVVGTLNGELDTGKLVGYLNVQL